MNTLKKSKKNYTQVSNIILRDERLSLKAKGLFAYMDSKPEGWNFTILSISSQVKDGKSSVEAALNELKKYHYLRYEKLPNGKGIYSLIDDPKPENPDLGFPKVGKSVRISNTISKVIQYEGQPTEKQVLAMGLKLGMNPEASLKFYLFYSAKRWKGILDYVPLMRKWQMSDTAANNKNSSNERTWG